VKAVTVSARSSAWTSALGEPRAAAEQVDPLRRSGLRPGEVRTLAERARQRWRAGMERDAERQARWSCAARGRGPRSATAASQGRRRPTTFWDRWFRGLLVGIPGWDGAAPANPKPRGKRLGSPPRLASPRARSRPPRQGPRRGADRQAGRRLRAEGVAGLGLTGSGGRIYIRVRYRAGR